MNNHTVHIYNRMLFPVNNKHLKTVEIMKPN